MSADGLNWAMQLRGLSILERLMLIYMGDSAGMDGWWTGDLDELAERIEAKPQAIQMALGNLEARGVIRRHEAAVYLSGADIEGSNPLRPGRTIRRKR